MGIAKRQLICCGYCKKKQLICSGSIAKESKCVVGMGKGLTLVPLLGPIGGGLATGAALASSVAVVAAGGAASSAARTTSLLPLFLEGGKDTIVTILVVLLGVTTFGVTTNPQAADAMLQLAMLLSSLSFFTKRKKIIGRR